MSEHRLLTVPEGAAGSRVDRFVADATGLSRAHVQRLIAQGLLTVDGQRLRARDPVRAGWHLELEVPEAASDEPLPEDIPLRVVYRDDDVLVVDKPAGLVTHPAPGHRSGTLVNALLGLAAAEARRSGPAIDETTIDETTIDEADPDVEVGTAEDGGGAGRAAERAGIVHRLDRDTSGLLMVARNPSAHVALQAQLKARRVRKTYLGLVGGVVNAQLGRIEKPIGRDPRTRLRMAVTADGRPAVTGYRVRERFGEWTLLELDLVTGRTHQIRVHLQHIRHPLLGDPVYRRGVRLDVEFPRQALHAAELQLAHPRSGKRMRWRAPLPADMKKLLARLRRASRDAG